MPSPSATIVPARRVQGRLRVPGDKSMSHRYALLSALVPGTSTIDNYAPGADCRSTLACLARLGVDILDQGSRIIVLGRGLRQFRPADRPLDAGNSGTTMRMLAGVLAPQPFRSQLVGDASLSRRPMRRVIEPLSLMGARIDSVDGHAPLTIQGTTLRPVNYRAPVPSAQVKSAVMLAALHAEGTTFFTEAAPTRDHTERAFEAFQFHVDAHNLTISVAGGQQGAPRDVSVPGDFSSAAFWMAAAAALPGSEVTIEEVGLNPTRTGLIDILRRFGARVEVHQTGLEAGEPLGSITVVGEGSGAVDVAPEEVPGVIDELPAIAALAAHGGTVTVRGAGELRVKESDRIKTLVDGFRALGIGADERPDGFQINGRCTSGRNVADACGDHRMAMAFAIAALGVRTPSRIEGADSVGISYPGFFETLDRLVR
jgi:3-phosphoshikimate 1-carboxyvinyltransferase